MDHVFNMLEQYASNLEEEVAERTKELAEEKKKSDILLYRMLPRLVILCKKPKKNQNFSELLPIN
jgi:guanylate cyclase, other